MKILDNKYYKICRGNYKICRGNLKICRGNLEICRGNFEFVVAIRNLSHRLLHIKDAANMHQNRTTISSLTGKTFFLYIVKFVDIKDRSY